MWDPNLHAREIFLPKIFEYRITRKPVVLLCCFPELSRCLHSLIADLHTVIHIQEWGWLQMLYRQQKLVKLVKIFCRFVISYKADIASYLYKSGSMSKKSYCNVCESMLLHQQWSYQYLLVTFHIFEHM